MEEPPVVGKIKLDAHWFSILFMRYTVTHWILTVLAAGSAMATAIKSANAGPLDAHVILWLTIVTVVATVLQGVIRPDKLAQKYRAGDLLMQSELYEYEGSAKEKADVDRLVAAAKRANEFLKD